MTPPPGERELLPCPNPWCPWRDRCACGVQGPDGSNEAEAVAAWNLRSSDDAGLELRPVVLAFAQLMEAKLRDNDHKPGWRNDSWKALLERLREETVELEGALLHATFYDTSDRGARMNPADLLRNGAAREAPDIANFAMMIADVCGALPSSPEQTAEPVARDRASADAGLEDGE